MNFNEYAKIKCPADGRAKDVAFILNVDGNLYCNYCDDYPSCTEQEREICRNAAWEIVNNRDSKQST